MRLSLCFVSATVIGISLIVSSSNATPFSIKGIESGNPPQAYTGLNVAKDCRVEGFGTRLECFEGIGGQKDHSLGMPITIAGEFCDVNHISFVNTSTPPDEAWLSDGIIFICDGTQQTYDNIRAALTSKFGENDDSTDNYSEPTMPWLLWFSGDHRLKLWPVQIPGYVNEVWVHIDDFRLKEEGKALELYLRNQDL